MKKKFLGVLGFLYIVTLGACTQESVVKNTALRHAVVKFDDELSKNPDADAVKEIKKKTQIVVDEVTMVSDKEANVLVTIKSVNPQNRTEPTSQALRVHVVKDSAWSVRE